MLNLVTELQGVVSKSRQENGKKKSKMEMLEIKDSQRSLAAIPGQFIRTMRTFTKQRVRYPGFQLSELNDSYELLKRKYDFTSR